MPKIKVFYHDNCYDGFGAAWVAHKKLGNSASYHSYKWNSPLPDMSNCYVYFVDVTCDLEQIRALEAKNCKVVVIDHHQTTPDKLKGFEGLIFDNRHSGAALCWQYWFNDESMPELLQYIQDRDLWKFNLRDTAAVHAVLESYPMDFKVWDGLDIKHMLQEAPSIMRLREQQVANIVEHIVWLDIAGYHVPMVNSPVMMSEVATAVLNANPSAQFAGYFFVREDERIQVGLRSKGNFDVSEIAKLYHGGGHKNAAGFEVACPEDLLIIKK